jgi:hypothetical protein
MKSRLKSTAGLTFLKRIELLQVCFKLSWTYCFVCDCFCFCSFFCATLMTCKIFLYMITTHVSEIPHEPHFFFFFALLQNNTQSIRRYVWSTSIDCVLFLSVTVFRRLALVWWGGLPRKRQRIRLEDHGEVNC